MRPKLTVRYAAALAVLAASALFGIDTSKLKPTGYVNDFAHAMDPAGKQRLEAYCANLERATGAQMAIVLVDTLDGDPIEDVANKLYREWGVGKKGKDEGILILVAVKDHKDRAEVGYGLEPIIPDGYAGGVLRNLRPILRQGNYAGALLAAAQQFGQRIAQDKGVALSPDRAVRVTGSPAPRGPGIPFPLLVLGFFAFLWIIGRISGGGGGGTGLLAGMLLGNIMGRQSGGNWGGGGFGGSSSGGGFGGFGGGDSGGGGSSSDW
jgi:uncharacterized protein